MTAAKSLSFLRKRVARLSEKFLYIEKDSCSSFHTRRVFFIWESNVVNYVLGYNHSFILVIDIGHRFKRISAHIYFNNYNNQVKKHLDVLLRQLSPISKISVLQRSWAF